VKIWNARHWKLDFIEAIDEFLTRTPNMMRGMRECFYEVYESRLLYGVEIVNSVQKRFNSDKHQI